MKSIAILITCFNRKDKTLSCLQEVFANNGLSEDYSVDVFIVDGGSKDGTPEAVAKTYPNVRVSVAEGLYWAGGMRQAWRVAASSGKRFDMFLLLNDDTDINDDCLLELLKADDYCLTHYGKHGIYVGSTADPITGNVSYGGNTDVQGRLTPNGEYQECSMGNANVMMVSYEVYEKLGNLCDVYTHGLADYDYTLRAVKAGIPVLVLPRFCGKCANDHSHPWLSQRSSLKKRIDYLYSPKGLAYRERLYFNKQFYPKQYFGLWVKLWLKTFLPFLWNLKK